MSLKQATGVVSDLGVRFNLLGILPTAVLATLVAALVASGAPGSTPDLDVVVDKIDELSGTDLVVLTAGVVVAGLVLQPLQLTLVRLLEGYWGSGAVGRRATALLVARHRRRRQALERATTATGDLPDPAEQTALVSASWRLRHTYPPNSLLLPTSLGNVLRAAEYRAGRPYGLDAVVTWPRLYPLLSPTLRAPLDDLRLQLDVAARFTAMFVLAAVVSAGLLITHGWWLLVPVGALVLAWMSYRATVAAAGAYGAALEVAFDLTHLELRKALHLSRPADRETERALNRTLTEFFVGLPTNLEYESD